MPSPTNLIDGFIGGMDTIFRYVAAAEDVGTSVVVSWVIEREFEFLAIGEFVTDHSQFSLTAQLLDGKGRSASTFFEMGTSAGNGPQQSAVASPGGTRTLSETGEIEYIAAEGFGRSSPAFPTESGGYRLTQSIGFSVQPTAAGQEFLIHLGGAVSEVFSSGGGDGTVPEPSSIAIWGGIGLVSLIARWRRKRRQSVAG